MATMIGPQVSVPRFQGPLYTYQGLSGDGFPKTLFWCCNERWAPEFNTIGAVYPSASQVRTPFPLPYYHGRIYSPSPPPLPISPYQAFCHSSALPFSMPLTHHWPSPAAPNPDHAAFGILCGGSRRPWTPEVNSNRRMSRRTNSDFSRAGWHDRKSKLEPLTSFAPNANRHLRRNSWCGFDGGARRNNARNGKSYKPKSPGLALAEETLPGVPRAERGQLVKNKTSTQNCTENQSEMPYSPWGAHSAAPVAIVSTKPAVLGAMPCTTHGADANDEELDSAPETSFDLQVPANSLSAYKHSKGGGLELRPMRAGWGKKKAGPSVALHRRLRNALAAAQSGLEKGFAPELTKTGTGGSYILRAVTGDPVALLKPEDEEPCALNNPRGRGGTLSWEGLKKGVRPGEGAVREVAAYLLDHEHFAGVPPTVSVCCRSKNKPSADRGCGAQEPVGVCKVGSLQEFIHSDVDCEELGPAAFSVKEVHKICVLDMRLANADRNGSNILARRINGGWELTPIDHGYCLPDTFEDICFEWKYWRQTKLPFDGETLEYIAKLDAKKDIKTLEAHGIALRAGCKQVFRACTSLLKKGAAHGLTPFEISNMMCREGFEPSPLETLFKVALAVYKADKLVGGAVGADGPSGDFASDEDLLMNAVDEQIDTYLADYAVKQAANLLVGP